jgi:hypothetical protein
LPYFILSLAVNRGNAHQIPLQLIYDLTLQLLQDQVDALTRESEKEFQERYGFYSATLSFFFQGQYPATNSKGNWKWKEPRQSEDPQAEIERFERCI